MPEGIEPKIHTLEMSETYGKFSVEPLERGYGHTLGNALRRVLLNYVPGAAITGVRIEGALHEFSTLPGVVEDTTELLLNIKELAIKIHGEDAEDEQPRVMRLEASGEGKVLAGDIVTPPDVEIINPEAVIAELVTKSARLAIDMWVERGRGYRRLDEYDRERRTADVIPIDAVFSPVVRVAYVVEPTRVGYRTDFDRLIIELWGNGTVAPNEAVSMAAKSLHEYLIIFFDYTPVAPAAEAEEAGPEVVRKPELEYRIEDLDFSVRTYNCLKKEQINTLGELVEYAEDDLLSIRNFGKRSLAEVVEKLGQFDLCLKEPPGRLEDELVMELDDEV
ncbi:MAG: DNA-directed RNA polymerase subunit alpha [Armatimonadota bacterium]